MNNAAVPWLSGSPKPQTRPVPPPYPAPHPVQLHPPAARALLPPPPSYPLHLPTPCTPPCPTLFPTSLCVSAPPLPLSGLLPLPPPNTCTEANLRDLRTQYASLLSEYEYWVDEAWVEGAIPAELLGTYFRNGPGLLVNTARHERHIFGE